MSGRNVIAEIFMDEGDIDRLTLFYLEGFDEVNNTVVEAPGTDAGVVIVKEKYPGQGTVAGALLQSTEPQAKSLQGESRIAKAYRQASNPIAEHARRVAEVVEKNEEESYGHA